MKTTFKTCDLIHFVCISKILQPFRIYQKISAIEECCYEHLYPSVFTCKNQTTNLSQTKNMFFSEKQYLFGIYGNAFIRQFTTDIFRFFRIHLFELNRTNEILFRTYLQVHRAPLLDPFVQLENLYANDFTHVLKFIYYLSAAKQREFIMVN